MRDSICALPWLHLATHPHGEVSLCCESVPNVGLAQDIPGEPLNINHNSLERIINSNSFRDVRQKMLQGKRPSACQSCYLKEERGLVSKRQLENKSFQFNLNKARNLTQDDGKIEPRFQFIELRLGNLCNLACRSCNAYSSSKWQREQQILHDELSFVEYPPKDPAMYNWPHLNSFWDELFCLSPQPRRFFINGGEPLLHKKHLQYFQTYFKNLPNNNELEIIYNTNLTALTDDIVAWWKDLPGLKVYTSIDDLNQRNHYLRYPANWQAITSNLEKLIKNNIHPMIIQTIGATNFYYLDDFYQWAQVYDLEVAHNFINNPKYLRVDVLPLSLRKIILRKIKNGLPKYLFKNLQNLWGKGEDNNQLAKFLAFHRVLDNTRKQSFAKTFPELMELIDNNRFASLEKESSI